MELKDFTEQEQKQIEKGLRTAEISDKEAAKKLLALVPQEWIKRIPFFVRGHATTKTVERVAKQYPELYAVAKRQPTSSSPPYKKVQGKYSKKAKRVFPVKLTFLRKNEIP